MKKICLLLAIVGLAHFYAQGQVFLQQNEHELSLNNGLHLFYTQLPGASQHEVMLSYAFGSMAEDSATDGLAYVCHTAFLQGLQQHLKKVDGSIKVDGRFGYDASTYRFTVSLSNFDRAIEAIAVFYNQVPDSNAIANAILQNATLFGVVQNTVMYPAEQLLLGRQWGARAPAMSLYGKVPTADSTTIQQVQQMYKAGYCMEFALFSFSGPDSFRVVWRRVQDMLGPINTCKNELFNTKLANLFPKPKLSSQLVYPVGNATPTKYQKQYHGPYVSYNVEATLAALVLKTLLTQSTTLDSLCDSMGIGQLRLAYDPLKFAASLTWHIVPSPDSLHVAYRNFDTLMALMANGAIIPTKELETAKTTLLQQFESVRNDPSKKFYLVSQYWAQSTLPWLKEYPELLKKIDAEAIGKLIEEYVLQQPYTTLLLLNDADSASYDFKQFATTYTAIKDINLYYQRNTANFASTTDDSTANALAQTLLINNTLTISLNSQAYKSELLDVKDDSLAMELAQYEGYYLYPNNLLGKKTYRLDIYRTAKLVSLLVKAGVPPRQLKGTGVLLKGQEGNEEYKVTVTPSY